MQFFRFGNAGEEKPGAIDEDGCRRDISAHVSDLSGENLLPEALSRLSRIDLSRCPLVAGEERLGPCIAGVRNFIGVGLNYADHAREAGFDVPKEPILFNKAPSCIVGANDDILLPRGSAKTDWEAEVAVVIGRHASYLDEAEAMQAIAGFCICNDLSERSFQMERGGQFMKGKGCPSFGPLGPWLVTPDEIADISNLALRLSVNGKVMQDGNTRDMLFDIPWLVSYISGFMALEPGDVITTGTPAGVGMAKKPPRYLKAGDMVELSVTGLGCQRQKVMG